MSDMLLNKFFSDNNNLNARMTLWMGDLDPWMDENFLKQVWLSCGERVVVKLIRNKRTSLSSGYAFIGFSSSQSAQTALTTIHGTEIPNSTRKFRLNWASGGGICDKKEDRAPEYSLFVGDLNSDIDETFLLSVFRLKYLSCHSAKIMTDPLSGLSRGYGFVRFLNQNEQQDAAIKMDGIICNERPMRVSFATPKTNQNQRYLHLSLQAPALVQQQTDPSNTTVFVGGLSSPVSEDELLQIFSPFGEVSYVKIPLGKGCGFVQYVHRSSAEQAIERMNGFTIGTSRIRLSWGRSQSDRLPTPPVSLLFDNLHMMSPTTTTTTLSTVQNSNNLLGSFRPLCPPQRYNQDHRLLFKSEDDWLNDGLLNDEDDWQLNGIYA